MFYSEIVVTAHLYLEMQQKEIEFIEITTFQEDKQIEIIKIQTEIGTRLCKQQVCMSIKIYMQH